MSVSVAAFDALNQTVSAMETSLSGGISDFPSSAVSLGAIAGASDINAGWTLTSGYLVFFMQVGFAMLCAGAVRAKNAKNIILLNLLDACFGCVAWYITGFAFAYGDPAPDADGSMQVSASQAFIGNRYFAMSDLDRTSYFSWFFQFTFAATAATIVSGAVAERCRFEWCVHGLCAGVGKGEGAGWERGKVVRKGKGSGRGRRVDATCFVEFMTGRSRDGPWRRCAHGGLWLLERVVRRSAWLVHPTACAVTCGGPPPVPPVC